MEIREGQFYVDGAPFYVRGIGYVPLRPRQNPGTSYTGVNYALMDHDFARIKAARFNTVRTWDALVPEELALAKKHGLMVIQGLRLDARQDFGKPFNRENAVEQAKLMAEHSVASDNVLGYLIMSKPHPSAVLDSGVPETLEYFRILKREIQKIDPRPVSMDSWISTAFLDHSDFDFVSFSAFDFWPASLAHSIGFPGTVRWLKERFSPNRPLLISATGGYGVSPSTRPVAEGVGGLSESEQSARNLTALRAATEGHAAGSVLVSWLDSWAAAGDPDTHDDNPWEWTGVLAIDTDSKKDAIGVPRAMFQDLSAFNSQVVLEPKANHLYPVTSPLAIQVNSSADAMFARYSMNGGDWKDLAGSGQGGWYGFLKLPKLAKRRQRLSIRVLDKDQTLLTQRDISFVAAVDPERVTIRAERVKTSGGLLQFGVDIKDGKNKAIAQRKVFVGCFLPVSGREAQGMVTTDMNGQALWLCGAAPTRQDRYIYIAAGTDSPDSVRTGDMRIFELGL